MLLEKNLVGSSEITVDRIKQELHDSGYTTLSYDGRYYVFDMKRFNELYKSGNKEPIFINLCRILKASETNYLKELSNVPTGQVFNLASSDNIAVYNIKAGIGKGRGNQQFVASRDNHLFADVEGMLKTLSKEDPKLFKEDVWVDEKLKALTESAKQAIFSGKKTGAVIEAKSKWSNYYNHVKLAYQAMKDDDSEKAEAYMTKADSLYTNLPDPEEEDDYNHNKFMQRLRDYIGLSSKNLTTEARGKWSNYYALASKLQAAIKSKDAEKVEKLAHKVNSLFDYLEEPDEEDDYRHSELMKRADAMLAS